MLRGDKFLSIGVRNGKIKSDSRTYALRQQQHLRLDQRSVRVGEILIEAGLLTIGARDEILSEQAKIRSEMFYRLSQANVFRPSLIGQRLLVALVVAAGAAVAVLQFDVAVDPATGIAGIVTLVLFSLLEYRAVRSAALSVVRALMFVGILFFVVAFVFSVFTFVKLDDIVTVHSFDSQLQVATWIFRVRMALIGLVAAAGALLGYSVWKFHALRYNQARLGLMKDVIIRVENVLRDTTKPIETRREEAISFVLHGLRNAIRLSLPDRTLRRLPFSSKAKDQITVMYFIPEPHERFFRLNQVAYADDAPGQVRDAFSWMQENHFPKFLDEQGFEELIRLAKGVNPHGWRERYLNFPNRHDFISICGWIYAKKETLFSRDASQCLAYDGRYFEGMKARGLTKDELPWVTFGSFIGCPVSGQDGEVASILLVAKSRSHTLEAEDLEISILAGQLIGRVLAS